MVRAWSEAQCSPACGGKEMKILWTSDSGVCDCKCCCGAVFWVCAGLERTIQNVRRGEGGARAWERRCGHLSVVAFLVPWDVELGWHCWLCHGSGGVLAVV